MTAPPFTPDEMSAWLRENVTVVKPGETLVIRVTDLSPMQMREYQAICNVNYDEGFLPFRCLIVHGDELGVASAESESSFNIRIAAAVTSPEVQKAIRTLVLQHARTNPGRIQ